MTQFFVVVLFYAVFISLLATVEIRKVLSVAVSASLFSVIFYAIDDKTHGTAQVFQQWSAILFGAVVFADVILVASLLSRKYAVSYSLYLTAAVVFSLFAVSASHKPPLFYFGLYTVIYFLFFAGTGYVSYRLFNMLRAS